MNVFTRLWSGLGELADAVKAMATTFREGNAELRGRLGLPAIGGPATVTDAIDVQPAPEPVNGHLRGRKTKV